MARRRACALCGLPTPHRWTDEEVELHGRADLLNKPVCPGDRESLTTKAARDLRRPSSRRSA